MNLRNRYKKKAERAGLGHVIPSTYGAMQARVDVLEENDTLLEFPRVAI